MQYYKSTVYTLILDAMLLIVDVDEVDRAVSVYGSNGVQAPVYLMAVGGTTDSYFKNGKAVAEIALKKGYRYSPRLHVDVFGNAWGT